MTHRELLDALDHAAEPTLESFQKKIMCDTRYPLLCVRVPIMRKIAKEAAKGDWKSHLQQCGFGSFEEVVTVGLVAAYAKAPLQERLAALGTILPHLDSWAMTDTIVPTLKVKPAERETAWEFAFRCIGSEREYVRRFGIIMLLDYFLTEADIPAVEEKILAICDERYYVRMACGWLLAEMAVSDYDRVENVLKSGKLDLFIHNMTIRKMRDSYRITPQQKAAAAALRRKETRR